MASIYRPSGRRKWYIEYRDAAGQRHLKAGYTDRRATEQLAARLERDAARGAEGLIDPYAEHAHRALAEHIADFQAHIEARGGSSRHPRETARAIERLAEAAGLKRLADLTAERLESWVVQRRKAGDAARTINYTLTAAKSFTAWLERPPGRIARDPLRHVRTLTIETDRRHVRRALTEAEFNRLLDAAAVGKPFRGLSGADRRVLYMVAAYTGYRRRALIGMTPESIRIAGGHPAVSIGAALAKGKRAHWVPVSAELAAQLRAWLAGKPAGRALWPGSWWHRSSVMLRADLAAAGIPYRDESGRVFDFHALRGQYGTMLARAGVHPRVAQRLMGHSDVNLTMKHYSHVDTEDLEAAAAKLPAPPVPQDPRMDQRMDETVRDRPPLTAAGRVGEESSPPPKPKKGRKRRA